MGFEVMSIEGVLANAQFHRRMGCPMSDDASELREALREVLASNDRLREQVTDLEAMPDALKDAEMALRCPLSEAERAQGDVCASDGLDCAECARVEAQQTHAAEMSRLSARLDVVEKENAALRLKVER